MNTPDSDTHQSLTHARAWHTPEPDTLERDINDYIAYLMPQFAYTQTDPCQSGVYDIPLVAPLSVQSAPSS